MTLLLLMPVTLVAQQPPAPPVQPPAAPVQPAAPSVPAANAQPQVTLDDMKTPPSPAFTLMGIAPTTVERPTTPRALGLAFLNAVENDGGGLPQNFSVEVAPYWLTPRPLLTFEQYDRAGFWQGLLQTFSVSLATKGADDDTGADTTPPATSTAQDTMAGAGVRASWLIGRRSALAQQVIDAYRRKAVEIALSSPAPTAATLGRTQISDADQATLRQFTSAIVETTRQGRWVIEAAAALSAVFPNDDTSSAQTQKAAVWITPAYRFVRSTFNEQTGELTQVPTVDFMAVARYINDRTAAQDGDGIDLGGRILWENEMFGLSAEFVQRLNVSQPTHRLTGMVEYKINDNLYLSGTFGKDFEDPATERGDLQAILGLNLNLGAIPKVLAPAGQ